jgi:hypothetical protein
MRPEKVSRWREQLPPPFDKPSLIQKRRASAACLEVPFVSHNGAEDVRKPGCVKRRNSAHGTLDQSDRKVSAGSYAYFSVAVATPQPLY